MYLEHFWLTVIGIFMAGVLSMMGVMLAMDAHHKAKRPRVPLTKGYDPRNPINARGMLAQSFEMPEERGWYEMKPIEWR